MARTGICRSPNTGMSERSAARLAHRSGGPGVGSSNLPAPTTLLPQSQMTLPAPRQTVGAEYTARGCSAGQRRRCFDVMIALWRGGAGAQTRRSPARWQGSLRFPRAPASTRVGSNLTVPIWANIGQSDSLMRKSPTCCRWVTVGRSTALVFGTQFCHFLGVRAGAIIRASGGVSLLRPGSPPNRNHFESPGSPPSGAFFCPVFQVHQQKPARRHPALGRGSAL